MVKTGVEVSEDQYTVKKAYDLLTREETEGCEWVKDVWNPLIPSKMSMLGWRLFQSRLPTKENLLIRGVRRRQWSRNRIALIFQLSYLVSSLEGSN
jgi:hypothetical protein